MLKKLLKYDLENVYKVLVVFYGLSIFFSILSRIFLNIENSFIISIIGKICSGTTIAMIFNILINNLMRLWVRFKQNFYGDESYLTHTLPVDKKKLYLSKTLTSIITLLSSVVVIVLSLFIAYYSKENIELIKNLLLPLANAYDSTIIGIILAFVFVCFLELMNILQSGYVGIVLGNMKNNNKMMFSILLGLGTYLLTQIFTIIIVFGVALFNKELMNLFYTMDTLNVDTIKLCIYLAIIIYSLNIFILYFINSKLFNKGVNVD
ncbi:MAG: hypothetical protein IJX34_04170 [Clostridia bacterium]|nr:hypothetical protein [Clostridia bacterium]